MPYRIDDDGAPALSWPALIGYGILAALVIGRLWPLITRIL